MDLKNGIDGFIMVEEDNTYITVKNNIYTIYYYTGTYSTGTYSYIISTLYRSKVCDIYIPYIERLSKRHSMDWLTEDEISEIRKNGSGIANNLLDSYLNNNNKKEVIYTLDSKYDKLFINYSKLVALESGCKKMKVGAVIVKDNRSISMGYNGSISGSDNCCEDTMEDGSLKTRDGIVHAEENAILYSAKIGLSLDRCSLYVTHMPCIRCARMIISVGINKVVYLNDYKDESGVELLEDNGLIVYKYDDVLF